MIIGLALIVCNVWIKVTSLALRKKVYLTYLSTGTVLEAFIQVISIATREFF